MSNSSHDSRSSSSSSSSSFALEEQLKKRKQQFGIDYIALIEKNAPSKELIVCLEKTMSDLNRIKHHQRRASNRRHDAALSPPRRSNSEESWGSDDADDDQEGSGGNNDEGEYYDDNNRYDDDDDERSLPAQEEAALHAATAAAAVASSIESVEDHNDECSESGDGAGAADDASKSAGSDEIGSSSHSSNIGGRDDNADHSSSDSTDSSQSSTGDVDVGKSNNDGAGAHTTYHPSRSTARKGKSAGTANAGRPSGRRFDEDEDRAREVISDSTSEHSSKKSIIPRDKTNKVAKSAGGVRRRKQRPDDGFQAGDEENPFADANPYQWLLNEFQFSGKARYETKGKEEKVVGKSIQDGIAQFKDNPEKYIAMLYETVQLKERWPSSTCEYFYVHREGTTMYQPLGLSEKGWMTILLQEYEALPSFEDNVLPMKYRDKWTDSMTFKGHKLHSRTNPPILPGRGMGVCDAPNIKVIGDVDPSDIHQGKIGDCWLLSGMSSLAEFDGAIKHLFRKTPGLHRMPREKPNKYIVTYYDLETWTETDICIDERLAVASNGGLLAAKPSADGELWVCYLEKAFAIHAGGWDKIVGGNCSHAWAVMTGCKYQYIITEMKPGSRRWHCALRYKESEDKWGKHANSPHDCDGLYYKARWPEVGGGGGKTDVSEEQLFEKMCAWDDANFVMGAGTTGTSDENSTGGMVDNHAYSVIDCYNDVAGTPIDLIKVRNPWGKGEIEDGEFDDDGPGWDKWPQVKAELNPVVADDGIFYLTPSEFFRFFGTIFLSASDMTEFLED